MPQTLEEQLTAAREEIDLLNAIIAMTVDRLGGIVEGERTHEGNFLQRIDELIGIEKRANSPTSGFLDLFTPSLN